MKLGIISTQRKAHHAIRVAKACEDAGFWGLGIGDTVSHLYQDAFVTTCACLQATSRLHVGPTVTNTVTRHWSVLATMARTFEELQPGRFFAGIGTGDGAVFSVGLKPAPWTKLESEIVSMRAIAPPDTEIHIAASGPRGAEAAGRLGTDAILGTGLDIQALQNLSARARSARVAAGVSSPLRTWAMAHVLIASDNDAAAKARTTLNFVANAIARFSFSGTFEDKAIPEEWQMVLRKRLVRYDYMNHGVPGTVNTSLFDDTPDLQRYLVDRFLLIDTAERCASRLQEVVDAASLEGVWLSTSAPTSVWHDPEDIVHAAGRAFAQLLTR